ncbi:MAG: penicillin-binding transpeptidase domain-containing protein [Labedaea sp.]
MTPERRRLILIGGGLLAVTLLVLGVILVLPGERSPTRASADDPAGPATTSRPAATEVVRKFAAAFETGDATTAGGLTDSAAAATAQLAAVRRGLGPQTVSAKPGAIAGPAAGASTARAPLTIVWTFGPARVWTYASTLPLVKDGVDWKVHWTPALVHPELTAETNLVLRAGATGQPAVVDRDGAPLLVWASDGAKPVDAALAPLLTPAMARVAGSNGGAAGWQVALVDATGAERKTLAGAAGGGQNEPVASTLGIGVQKSAQAAVDTVSGPAMLVAIQPSTGDILAVAQNSAAGADPLALHGQYPPGSTFKIVTATAVLEAGAADVNTVLSCPSEITVGSRTIPNEEHVQAGEVPMHTAFARSCNTTFGKLAAGLPATGLRDAADQYGQNADFVIPGISTETGKVEPAESTTQRIEDGIGQGRVQASPLGSALMSATVARGTALTPRLWRSIPTEVTNGYQAPPRAVLDKVRSMMREVVTAGTAKALAGRGAVFGKTGTAQFGTGEHAHGWFTGYRGDVAFAVFVDGGESSKPAVAIAGTFLGGVR